MNQEQRNIEEYAAYEHDTSVGMQESIARHERCVDADLMILNRQLAEIIVKLDRMEAGHELSRMRIDRIDNRLNSVIRNQHTELTKLRSIETTLAALVARLA